MPSPKELRDDLNDSGSKLTPQQRYDRMIKEEFDKWAEDNPDPDDTTTPDGARNGTVWASLTENPTSTTNVEEPRTLAAGYDRKNFILTIQFRDGTLYNYYDVPPSIWREFRFAESKGKYMQSGLDSWAEKGPVAGHSHAHYARVAKSARKAQVGKFGSIDQILGRNK